MIDAIEVHPDHLRVAVAGAPPLLVELVELGLRSAGVGSVVSKGRGHRSPRRVAYIHGRETNYWRPERMPSIPSGSSDETGVRVNAICQRMAAVATCKSDFSHGRQQAIADRDHGRRLDRLLEPSATGSSPLRHERAVTQFSDRHSSEEQLVACQIPDVLSKVRPPSSAQRGAEHAGVDNQPHDRIAAANASSSSSDRSSISNASAEVSTGAATNCSVVRSGGNSALPCGAPP